jgi:uncharacterized protein with beta-barrel porin domain
LSNTMVTCSGSSTTPVVAATGSSGVTIDVVVGASVAASHSGAVPFPALSVYQDSTITNYGTLSLSGNAGSSANAGAAMLGAADGNTLTNAAGATITTTGAFNDGMAANGSGNTLTNNGTITTTGPNAYGMSAAWAAVNTGQANNTLTNTGAVSTSGIDARAASILGNNGTINNSGTLSASGAASNAAYLQGNNDLLINSGTVTATGASANAVFSNTVSSAYTATIENLASGQITSQTGSAIVTLNGNTTIINAGLVQSGGGTAITMGNGNDSLVLQTGSNIIGTVNGGAGSNTVTLQGTGTTSNASNQFVNFQTLMMQGGAWTWTGSDTFTTALVQNGTLEVDGSIAAASGVTVDTGAKLSGTGAVAGTTINSGGTLAPGNSANPTGTLTITGNLAFAGGALYLIAVSGGNAGSASVNGTAALGGAVQVSLVSVPAAKTYDILHAEGGLGGTTFGGVTTAANFTANLTYTTTDVLLNLGAALGNTSMLGQNQQAVAGQISNSFNAGRVLPASLLNVFDLTGARLQNALGQIDGEVNTDAERAAFELMNQFLGLMVDPFVDGRFDGGISGFAPDREASLPPDIAMAYASVLKAPPKVYDNRWSVWGTGFGGSSQAGGDPAIGSNGATTNTYGFASGADYHFTRDTLLGFALAGAGTNWDMAQLLGNGRSDAFQAGLYGRTAWGPVYVAAALAYTENWFTTNRFALSDQLTANFNGESYGGRLEGGYRYVVPSKAGQFEISPYAAVQAQSFHTPSYGETDLSGGGLGLNFNAMNTTDTRGELGMRFADMTAVDGMPLSLRAKLAWAHDWVDNPALDAVFQTLPGSSFVVDGAPLPSDSALVSLGAELHMTMHWSAIAKFDGEFANDSQTYGGTGTLRYTW